jgi:hypothetical protein
MSQSMPIASFAGPVVADRVPILFIQQTIRPLDTLDRGFDVLPAVGRDHAEKAKRFGQLGAGSGYRLGVENASAM